MGWKFYDTADDWRFALAEYEVHKSDRGPVRFPAERTKGDRCGTSQLLIRAARHQNDFRLLLSAQLPLVCLIPY